MCLVLTLLSLQELLQVTRCEPFVLGAVEVEEPLDLWAAGQLLEQRAELLKVEFSIDVAIRISLLCRNRPYSHKGITINNYVNCRSNFIFGRSICLFHMPIFEEKSLCEYDL